MKKLSRWTATYVALLGAGLTSTFALPVWNGGNYQIQFDPGDGRRPNTLVGPIPDWMGVATTFTLEGLALNGTFNARAQGGFFHVETPDLFGLVIPAQTKVSQTNADAAGAGPASLRLKTTGPASWIIQDGPFGPTLYGLVMAPWVHGEVAPGAGSYARLDVTATWGPPTSTRDAFVFSQVFNAPGQFALPAIVDFQQMIPDFLLPSSPQTLAFDVKLTAYGVGGKSEIILGSAHDPGAPRIVLPFVVDIPDRRGGLGAGATAGGAFEPVPEPSTYGLFAAIGLLALGVTRRWRRPSEHSLPTA